MCVPSYCRKHKNKPDMKRIRTIRIITVLTALMLLPSAAHPEMQAKGRNSVIGVIQKYDNSDGVESINIGPFLMKIARTAADDEGKKYLKHLNRMIIFSAEEVSGQIRERIADDFRTALRDYETLMDVTDEEDKVTICIKRESEETISEMVIYVESELTAIVMSGKIPVSEIQSIAEEAMQDQ